MSPGGEDTKLGWGDGRGPTEQGGETSLAGSEGLPLGSPTPTPHNQVTQQFGSSETTPRHFMPQFTCGASPWLAQGLERFGSSALGAKISPSPQHLSLQDTAGSREHPAADAARGVQAGQQPAR